MLNHPKTNRILSYDKTALKQKTFFKNVFKKNKLASPPPEKKQTNSTFIRQFILIKYTFQLFNTNASVGEYSSDRIFGQKSKVQPKSSTKFQNAIRSHLHKSWIRVNTCEFIDSLYESESVRKKKLLDLNDAWGALNASFRRNFKIHELGSLISRYCKTFPVHTGRV